MMRTTASISRPAMSSVRGKKQGVFASPSEPYFPDGSRVILTVNVSFFFGLLEVSRIR
jgi:hypothetical protein